MKTITLNRDEVRDILTNHFEDQGIKVEKFTLTTETIEGGFGDSEVDVTTFKSIEAHISEGD